MHTVWLDAVAEFQKETGITVHYEVIGGVMPTRLVTAITGGEGADVVQVALHGIHSLQL